jgi:hypothetical protein
MPTICPECKKDDAIQRLSSVVSSGEASGSFSGPSVGITRVDGKWGTTGGYTTLSGTTMTELARKLTPPSEPRKSKLAGAAYPLLGIGLWGLSLIAVLGGASLPVIALLGSSVPPIGRPLLCVAGVINVLIGIAMIIGGFLLIRQQGKAAEAARARYEAERQAWEEAMTKYDRSYYCFRDDVVFDAQTGESCDPDSLRSFLYSKRS